MNVDIHFTDDQGNEFYIGIRNGDVSQVWKNKIDIGITNASVYIEESKLEMFIDDEEWEREMGR